MTDTRARTPWPYPAAHDPGWGPPLPPPPDPGWEQQPPPPPAPPGWAPPPAPVGSSWAGEPLPPAPPTTWPTGTTPPSGGGLPPEPPAEAERPGRSRPPVGLQNLLLGLGTGLVAIAVVVFTAVNWSQLGASVQGLVLVAVTVAAGAAASLAARRDMPSTAEALGLVAVLLALADVHAFRVGLAPAADPSFFWAGGFAVAAGFAGVLGRASRIRSPQIAAGVLVQAPLLCILAAADATVWASQLAVVAQAFAVLAVAEHLAAPRWARRAACGWAVAVAALLTAATTFDSLVGELLTDADADLHRGATGACLLAAAALGAYVAWMRAESAEIRPVAQFASTSTALAAVWFVAVDPLGPSTAIGLVALASSLVLLAGRRVPAPWGDVPAATAGIIGLGAVLPLVGAVASMLVASSTVSSEAWARSGSQVAASLQLADSPSYAAAGLALQLVAVAVAVVALVRRDSKVGLAVSAAVVGLAGLALSPLLAPITITTTVLVALAAVVLGAVAAVLLGARSRVFPVAGGFAVLAYAWATPWSLATPGLTFATLATGIVAAAAVGIVARRDGAAEAGGLAAVWVAAATPLLAGLVTWDAGAGPAMAWAVAAVAAALVSILGVVLLDPRGTTPEAGRIMRQAVEATALVGYLGALIGAVCAADPDAASVALAAGVIGFGLHAVRPGHRLLGLVAGSELLALIWLRLGQAEVVLVEAYTLPLAALLLVAGLVGSRPDPASAPADGASEDEVPSWVAYGPALVVGLAPTVWLAFTQPGSIRPLVGLVAGALVLVAGVAWGKRAFVDVGTATVVALGLRQIAPVAGEMPNWATIGATGVVLILVGATFEQRRRDLKAVLRRYSALT